MSAILSFFGVVHNRGSPIEKHSTSRIWVCIFHSEGNVVPFINLVNYLCKQQNYHFHISTEIEKTEKTTKPPSHPDSCIRPYLYSVMLLLPVARGTHWITTATGLPSPGLDRNAQVIVTLRRPAPAERTYDRPSRAVTACHWASQNRTNPPPPPKYNDFGATRLQKSNRNHNTKYQTENFIC
ncbi:uncharacterized protein B0T23DRAFT_407981 [Neurospora hispaniola]|uniref:Uncharacterized protein n=1 Tax=Neurospora hispaniola TaxID=588809 RepID=A0AAJ0HZT1_9PEZI|nr:hypothetical protein B0T23DRAFT_407981 [Neurospora hispaniola]